MNWVNKSWWLALCRPQPGNGNLSSQKRMRRVWKCSKYISRGYGDVLKCENGGCREARVRKLPNMGKNAKCELEQARTRAEGLEVFEIDSYGL